MADPAPFLATLPSAYGGGWGRGFVFTLPAAWLAGALDGSDFAPRPGAAHLLVQDITGARLLNMDRLVPEIFPRVFRPGARRLARRVDGADGTASRVVFGALERVRQRYRAMSLVVPGIDGDGDVGVVLRTWSTRRSTSAQDRAVLGLRIETRRVRMRLTDTLARVRVASDPVVSARFWPGGDDVTAGVVGIRLRGVDGGPPFVLHTQGTHTGGYAHLRFEGMEAEVAATRMSWAWGVELAT